MKNLAFTLLMLCSAASFAVDRAPQPSDYAAGELMVRFANPATAQVAMRAVPGTPISEIPEINVVRFKLRNGVSVLEASKQLQNSGLVAFAEPNFKKILIRTPNDPRYSQQYGPRQIRLPDAWALSIGRPQVKVAIIDTGVNLLHEDLRNKIVPGGRDFSDNDNDPMDYQGHGTHCAGIAAADTNNGLGVAGAGWNSTILPLKIFPNAFDAVSSAAIIYAADQGCKVVSMSYGSYFPSQTEQAALNYAWNRGVLLVGGVGNDNTNSRFYPAALDNVLSVGGTDATGQKVGFSNFGDWVSVAAPGDMIMSTMWPGTNNYDFMSGTSMSTPLVAGSAALLFGYSPSATNLQVRRALENTTDNVGTWLRNGRINMARAIRAVPSPEPFFDRPNSVDVFTVGDRLEGVRPSGFTTASAAAPLVQQADTLSFDVRSIFISGTGQVAGARVWVPVTRNLSTVRNPIVRVRARTNTRTSGFLFGWNFARNEWVRLSSFSNLTENRTTDVAVSNLGDFIREGRASFAVRAVMPTRLQNATYTLSVDQVVISGFEQLEGN